MSLQAQSTNLHAQLNTNANDPSLLDWPLGLCDCCSYKDPMTGSCQWCPYFIPMSVFGTCCIVGRIQSLLMHEKPLCCEMGCGGWSCCCLSMPINFLAPLGTSCVRRLVFWCCCCFLRPHHMCSHSPPPPNPPLPCAGGACYYYSLATVYMADVEGQYNLRRHTSNRCCCSGCNQCCNSACELIYNAFSYPCLFFQIYMTLKELKSHKVVARKDGTGNAGNTTSSPLNQQGDNHTHSSNHYNPKYANAAGSSGEGGFNDEHVPIAVAVAYPQSD